MLKHLFCSVSTDYAKFKERLFIYDYEFAEGILKNTKDIEVKK